MERKHDYELLSGDVVCATFIEGKLNILDPDRAPLYLADFTAWVASRAISSSRGLTARNLKVASGLSANEASFETAMKVHAACVTDNYWVRHTGSVLTYKDVCFEDYDGFFQKLALGEDFTFLEYKSDRSNPELTNIGGSDKAWVIDKNGVRWLYKRQPLSECFNEILSSRLARAMGIDTVDYELAEYSDPDPERGRYGVVRSRDFTQGKNINFEPALFLLKHYGFTDQETMSVADMFSSWGLESAYLDIKYLDILTGNPDRHSQNYGILRDCDTGDIVGLAPNFDNNFAFLARDVGQNAFIEAAAKHNWVGPSISSDLVASVLSSMKEIEGLEEYAVDRIVDDVIGRSRYKGSSTVKEDNKIYIALNKAFCRQMDDKFMPGKMFNIMTMPAGTNLNGKDIGGCTISPMYMDESKYNSNEMVATYYLKEDEPLMVKLTSKDGSYEKVDVKELKDAIDTQQKAYREQQAERQTERTIDKSITNSKDKEAELE